MQQKPQRWNVSPALIAPEARQLWKGVAFVLPCFQGAHLGGNVLLGPTGAPLGGASLTAGSTAEKRATPYGYGIGISGASNLLTRNDTPLITTSDGAYTGEFSLFVFANPIAEARTSIAISQAVSDGSPQCAIVFNAANTSGRLQAAMPGASNFDSIIDGNYHAFGAVRRTGTTRAFVDGRYLVGNSSIGAIGSSAAGIAIGNRAEGNSVRIGTTCNIVFAAAWNRALSNAEMRLLARDPFIMIRPYAEWPGLWTPPPPPSGGFKPWFTKANYLATGPLQ